ncbi:DUF1361 domain-containing protein [Patescibacteria group bacterium]|nr:DUF1361 domain-containing protein [Patescibacteria group bacterium]MBU1663044.1 DUF1361 domain-containing protein [Patescibacteria group bacterium]MBU1934116.1 DUF1361 domain-containing protein [Patescibacteria group bacterium]MBU2007915.1 DUF1361 domain-containing protein [Patescibacteria group bacterium]MBU2233525.1 DUF1361 domain-containing protein [Patescibacteria group bacterium]
MDKIIHFYDYYSALSNVAVNHYQLVTVVWNIFLALLPLVFYMFLKSYWRRTGLVKFSQKMAAAVLFIFWLLFFPNTAYIITDIRHLLNYCPLDSPDKVCAANAWMIIVFFTYSSFGWVCFYYLLKLMSDLVNEIFNKLQSYFFIALIIPITSLGVLLGLLNRFNSWDVFLFPHWLAQVFLVYFLDMNYFMNWFIFTIFLYLLYLAGDIIFREIKK